jgi:hypothetical protein
MGNEPQAVLADMSVIQFWPSILQSMKLKDGQNTIELGNVSNTTISYFLMCLYGFQFGYLSIQNIIDVFLLLEQFHLDQIKKQLFALLKNQIKSAGHCTNYQAGVVQIFKLDNRFDELKNVVFEVIKLKPELQTTQIMTCMPTHYLKQLAIFTNTEQDETDFISDSFIMNYYDTKLKLRKHMCDFDRKKTGDICLLTSSGEIVSVHSLVLLSKSRWAIRAYQTCSFTSSLKIDLPEYSTQTVEAVMNSLYNDFDDLDQHSIIELYDMLLCAHRCEIVQLCKCIGHNIMDRFKEIADFAELYSLGKTVEMEELCWFANRHLSKKNMIDVIEGHKRKQQELYSSDFDAFSFGPSPKKSRK